MGIHTQKYTFSEGGRGDGGLVNFSRQNKKHSGRFGRCAEKNDAVQEISLFSKCMPYQPLRFFRNSLKYTPQKGVGSKSSRFLISEGPASWWKSQAVIW